MRWILNRAAARRLKANDTDTNALLAGFKSTAQAQVVNDATWYPDVFEAKPWLVYYISRPLIGTWEEVKIIPAVLPSPDQPKQLSEKSTAGPSDNSPKKKDIATFHELLNNFPMIARQMQPGLESLFNEFSQVFQKPLPPPPSATEIPDPRPDGPITMAMKRARSNSMSNITTGSQASLPVMEDFFAEDDEDIMRASLETAVTTAIDLFQSVDKQQLSLLGATTDLTGPLVEKLLERYITENIHHMLFSKLASLRRPEDLELEAKIRQMEYVDISQLGLSIDGGLKSKHDLIIQLGPAIEEFKKLSNAMSPQEMLDILLSTMKTASQLSNASASDNINDMPAEKAIMTVNADTLVSLLLYVVIRAQIKNLHARLSYIRNFIFVEDVDSGEMGYALSTFEAVLTYLVSDSAGLRRASRRNKALWDAAKKADMLELRKIMEPTSGQMHVNGAADDDITARDLYGSAPSSRRNSVSWGGLRGSRRPSISLPTDPIASTGSNLSHVFPFQNGGADEDDDTNDFSFRPKIKRVSMETRSLSSMSDISYHSRTASIGTLGSAFEGDISVERLAQTSDSFGESVLMLAVQNQHANVLRYLLSLRGYFPWENVIEDMNNEDTTLLSAAVQLGNMELIEMILDYVMSDATHEQLLQYIRRQDIWGRSVGHYLFNAPSLISRVGKLVPWRQRDKNGQTPLFALCRSYDHADYYDMVEAGMKAARIAQGDDEWLHVDQHVDGKGNTLLHIMSDPRLAFKVLHQSDVDVNAKNEKKFTPLMVASKYGRYDMVRALFADPRVDLAAREARGLTAVELAKDEDVRNKIDDLGLFSMPPADDGRITGVVRGFFVEDGTVRLVLKSAAPTDHDSYTVTTSRRSQGDFEQLARLLAEENPASWIPAVSEMRSPFQLPSKPSRALLRDIQLRSDWFLRIMLNHPSLARHEMLWEFFLVPELQLGAMEQRTNLKVEARRERVRDEFEPVRDLRDVEQFVNHAKESVRSVNHATKSVTRRANSVGLAASGKFCCPLQDRLFCSLLVPTLTNKRNRLVRCIGAAPPGRVYFDFPARSACSRPGHVRIVAGAAHGWAQRGAALNSHGHAVDDPGPALGSVSAHGHHQPYHHGPPRSRPLRRGCR